MPTKKAKRKRRREPDAPRVIVTQGPEGVRVDVLTERRPPIRVTRS